MSPLSLTLQVLYPDRLKPLLLLLDLIFGLQGKDLPVAEVYNHKVVLAAGMEEAANGLSDPKPSQAMVKVEYKEKLQGDRDEVVRDQRDECRVDGFSHPTKDSR